LKTVASKLKAILRAAQTKTHQDLNRAMIYEQADEVSRLLELRTAATSANDYVSDLVCFFSKNTNT
jgi:hypothetical protein